MSSSHRLILGTAGHIDHGKTSLIRALTGVDCDRLPEEQSRGITIELGFAPLDLPSGTRLGIVDVPGHEKLVRTMVSGATGIDLVLFVVAADEGMMPQSREHLAICQLLGVKRGVVALTKIDAVDPDLAELARIEVEEEIANSALAGSRIVPVSAHTGDGLPKLLAELDTLAEARPDNVENGPAWLPIDRAFTSHGFGTIVTGTLRGGTIETGSTLELFPDRPGPIQQARVRGLQVHGETVERAPAGARCAINLQSLRVSEVPRGSVLATPGRLDYRRRVDVQLTTVANAPCLRSGGRWTAHLGTTERTSRLRLLEGGELEPGQTGLGELRFDVPTVALEHDRFILRGYARIPGAGWTIGGGRVLDAAPFRGRRNQRDRIIDLQHMAKNDQKGTLLARVRRTYMTGIHEDQLRREVLSLDGISGIRVGTSRWIAPEPFEELITQVCTRVADHHKTHPEESWVGLAAIASGLSKRVPEAVIRAALDAAADSGRLEESGSGVRTPGHYAHVANPELAKHMLREIESAGLAPETLETLATSLGNDAGKLRPIAEHLVEQGKLVRIASGHYYARPAIDTLRNKLVQYLEANGEITPTSYKELTRQTRKFTVPIMEYFDAERLTVRRGNVRVLRGR